MYFFNSDANRLHAQHTHKHPSDRHGRARFINLWNFEIVHAQFANFSPKSDSNRNPDPNSNLTLTYLAVCFSGALQNNGQDAKLYFPGPISFSRTFQVLEILEK